MQHEPITFELRDTVATAEFGEKIAAMSNRHMGAAERLRAEALRLNAAATSLLLAATFLDALTD